MFHQLVGLLRTPDGHAHVVVRMPHQLSIFMPPYVPEEETPGILPAATDLDRWVRRAMTTGVETAAVVSGVPFPMAVHTQLQPGDGKPIPRSELRGFAQQPWVGLLSLLWHRFQGDPTAPALPDGYTFTLAVSTEITRGQAAEC